MFIYGLLLVIFSHVLPQLGQVISNSLTPLCYIVLGLSHLTFVQRSEAIVGAGG